MSGRGAALHQTGYRVSIVNPLRIKRYGESELLRVKTDKSDAALIARFCLRNSPIPDTAEQRAATLANLVRALADLQRVHQQERCRQQSGRRTPLWPPSPVRSSPASNPDDSLRKQIEAHILRRKA